MAKFLVETSLTVKLRRVFEVEAPNADEAVELWSNDADGITMVSEENVKIVCDEYIVSTKEKIE